MTRDHFVGARTKLRHIAALVAIERGDERIDFSRGLRRRERRRSDVGQGGAADGGERDER